MAERLYLIRINVESFLGPFTLDGVRSEYKKMHFGLQDEIAASNKPWVAFDDLPKIQKIYPELLPMIKKEMLSGWAVTDNLNTKIINNVSHERKPKKGGVFSKVLLLLIASFVGVSAFYLSRNKQYAMKFLSQKDPHVKKAQEYLDQKKSVHFEAYMDKYRKKIVKSRNLKQWLPYLRLVAFSRNGSIDGLRSRVLRGSGSTVFAPKDCSVGAWKHRWEKSTSEWRSFLDGELLPKKDWARVLLWDPHWINRRTPAKDWIAPKSYYEGCLMMGHKALLTLDIETDELNEKRKVLESRLRWQLKLISDSSLEGDFPMAGTVWALSCYESSEEIDSLNECRIKKTLGPEWLKHFEQIGKWNEIRILMEEKQQLSSSDLQGLKSIMPILRGNNPYSRLDYNPEVRFFQEVIANQGQLNKASVKAGSKYPHIKFWPH